MKLLWKKQPPTDREKLARDARRLADRIYSVGCWGLGGDPLAETKAMLRTLANEVEHTPPPQNTREVENE